MRAKKRISFASTIFFLLPIGTYYKNSSSYSRWRDKCSILIGISAEYEPITDIRDALLVSQCLSMFQYKEGKKNIQLYCIYRSLMPFASLIAKIRAIFVGLFFSLSFYSYICMLFVSKVFYTLFEFLIGFFVLLLFSARFSFPFSVRFGRSVQICNIVTTFSQS